MHTHLPKPFDFPAPNTLAELPALLLKVNKRKENKILAANTGQSDEYDSKEGI